MKTYHNHIITKEQAGLTVEAYLKQVLRLSGRKLQKLTRQKGILLNGKSVFLQKKLKENDSLRLLVAADANYGLTPEEGPLEVLYEDAFMFVLNKPPGLLVHPTSWTCSGTLANYLAWHLQQRGIILAIRPLHRLDRDTSGCVVFAKSDHSQFLLEQQLKSGRLTRTYTALVQGAVEPPTGTIAAPIGPHPTHPNRRAVQEHGDSAVTHYRTLEQYPQAALLEIALETGRTHQIRVHLAHIKHPVIGDKMYGEPAAWMKRQALHASALTFNHLQEQRPITIKAPLPADFRLAIAHCRQPAASPNENR